MVNSSLLSGHFEHIDYRKRVEAEKGQNPVLWMLYQAHLLRHAKDLIKSREDHPDTNRQNVFAKLANKRWIYFLRQKSSEKAASLRLIARQPKPSTNTFILGFENLPLMPDRQARPRSSAPGSRAATTDSGGGGPDEPDPDPDPERPYIALGIDHKATTPAGPPVPVSLRLFSLYRIEMRYCHEGDQPDHPEP
jgi:hypothetical protein